MTLRIYHRTAVTLAVVVAGWGCAKIAWQPLQGSRIRQNAGDRYPARVLGERGYGGDSSAHSPGWLVVAGAEPKSDVRLPAKPAAANDASASDAPSDDAVKEIVSGKVVMLADALKSRGVKSYKEEIKDQVVLVTADKELIPLVPDWRGRAFYQDERLRDRPVDLIVNRRPGVPWVQVLSIYTFDEKGTRQITDYWCDVCAIPMYEIKDCECCQGPTRLRFRIQDLPRDLPSRTNKNK